MAQNQETINYMVVDGVFSDYIQEIASYIDRIEGHVPDEEGSIGQFETETAEVLAMFEEEGDNSQLQDEIINLIMGKNSAILSNYKAEKELEPIFNLIMHVVMNYSSAPTSADERLKTLVSMLLQFIQSSSSTSIALPLIILSIMTNLFNILPTSSPIRFLLFMSLLTIAKSTKNIHLLAKEFNNLPAWLEQWKVSDEDKSKIYSDISEIFLSPSLDDYEKSYKYLYDAVSCMPVANDLTVKLVKSAFVSDYVYDFEDILSLPAVTGLKTDAKWSSLYTLLQLVSSGNFQEYKKFSSSTVASLELDASAVERKVKVIALTGVVSSRLSERSIKYSEISDTMEVPIDEVESWVIDAIRAGLIEGRLNQMEQQFDIHRASPVGTFGVEQWQQLGQTLTKWRSTLRDVLEVVKNARESAQKERTKLNKHFHHQHQQQHISQQQQQQQQQETAANN